MIVKFNWALFLVWSVYLTAVAASIYYLLR